MKVIKTLYKLFDTVFCGICFIIVFIISETFRNEIAGYIEKRRKKMKKFTLLVITCLMFMMCSPSGTTTNYPVNDSLLPDELKGLKIYSVAYGKGTYIQIAINKNKEILAESYSCGKSHMSVTLMNKSDSLRNIFIEEIISENDSIIVAKKILKNKL